MAVQVVRLQRDNLLHEYGCDTQRLQPWAVLNAPFEGSFATVRAGTQSTLHSHHEHEIFIAIRGEVTIECDGDRAPFRSGDVAFFQPGLEHQVINDTDQDFEFYSVWWDQDMAENFIARFQAEKAGASRAGAGQ
jgi:mannose-6-phosphate isomerase-like protein (cupin superfamily)